MRIAQLAPSILPVPPLHYGGTERVIHDLSLGLQRRGHDVTLLGPADSTTPVSKICADLSVAQYKKLQHDVPPGLAGALEAATLQRLCEQAASFDIIHCHTEFLYAPALHAHRHKLLATIHWRTDELDRQRFFAAFPELKVAAISASQQRSIPLSNRAGVIHHGIDPERYQATSQPSQRLAFLGRMSDQKGPVRALEVARLSGLPITLAGGIDEGNQAYFEREVAPRLSDRSDFVGALDDKGKNELLGDACALLFPIDWPEPFGLVMIEAMACGTPVIAWRNGAVAEVVEHGVTGFVVDSIDQAVEAVGQLEQLDRADIRRRFEARFSAQRMAADYEAMFERVLASGEFGVGR